MEQLLPFFTLALKLSIFAQVFAIGLATSWDETTYLFRRPLLLWNSILARNVIAPIVAIVLIKAFSLRPAVTIALAVLSLTPVPPLLLRAHVKSQTATEYAVGLLVSQAVLAIALVPATVRLMAWALGAQAQFSVAQVALLIIETILLPLGLGMIATSLSPKLRHLVKPLLMAGGVLLLIGSIPLLWIAWRSLGFLVGNGTLLAMAIFVVVTGFSGHLLGGPCEENRTTLALASSARHPGLAIAIAAANFPQQSKFASGAIVIYLVLRAVCLVPYIRWRRRIPKSPVSSESMRLAS